ncbi:hypothetical protein P3T40_003713 [Paraburkholderia sp. EB58]|jgi:hypothetical protein
MRSPTQISPVENGASWTKYRGACLVKGEFFQTAPPASCGWNPYAGVADESERFSLAPRQSRNRQMQSQLAPIRTRENDEPQATQR